VSLLHYALPAGLLLYFVWRALRQRVFLLGIPFLMYMSFSVFFDKAKPFWIPGRLASADHVMLWLVVVWVLTFDLLLPERRRAEQRPRVFGPALSSPEEFVLVGFAGLATLELVLTVLRFGELSLTLGQAKGFVYLFAGYFLLRGILCHASRSDSLDLLTSLVVVNTLAAGLFVLHQGLHLPIYAAVEYQTITFMGQQFTRSFYFMPQLLTLSLAFCFAKPKWSVFWVAVMIVTLAALWVSYTRSLLLIAVAVFFVVLGVRLLKARQAGRAVRRALAIVAIVGVFGVVAFASLPVQSRYFVSRITATTQTGSVVGDTNLQNRMEKLRRVYAWIAPESHVLGQGYVTAGQEPTAKDIEWMSADLVWVPVLYHLGVLGVAAVLLLYGAAGWRALSMSLSGDEEAEFVALVLLGALAGTLIESLFSVSFLNAARYPMGLWLFALLGAEACRRRVESAAQLVEPVIGGSDAV
jgi:hypothetical protein